MTYEELKKAIEELGFVFEDDGYAVWVVHREGYTLARVDKHNLLCVDMGFVSYQALTPDVRRNIFDLCVELSKTPLEDREPPVKKYYLKHKFIKSLDRQTYLTKNEKYFWLTKEIETDETYADYQQFTLDEIEEIKEKFGVTLEDWELVEVEE